MDLQAIEARLEAAPEPEKWQVEEGWEGYRVFYKDDGPGDLPIAEEICQGTDSGEALAEFIAHAPEDIAALVTEVERLRATVIVEQNRRQPWVKLAHQNSQEVKRLRRQIDAVRALHRPAHAVFSWNGGTIYEDPCPQCHGAPGVHPCGCWADTQLEYVCAECHRLGVLSKGVYDYTYPCPTICALEVGE